MKRTIYIASLILIALSLNSTVIFAEDTGSQIKKETRTKIEKRFPKLYDEAGNELKCPPKPGQKIYDENGVELNFPKVKPHHPKGPKLNLTEEQIEKANEIRKESRQKMKPIRREMHNIKNEIWEVRESDELTIEEKDAKIEQLVKEMKELRTKANEIRQEDMKKFESILTKKQKKELDNFKKTHKKPMPKRSCPLQKQK